MQELRSIPLCSIAHLHGICIMIDVTVDICSLYIESYYGPLTPQNSRLLMEQLR